MTSRSACSAGCMAKVASGSNHFPVCIPDQRCCFTVYGAPALYHCRPRPKTECGCVALLQPSFPGFSTGGELCCVLAGRSFSQPAALRHSLTTVALLLFRARTHWWAIHHRQGRPFWYTAGVHGGAGQRKTNPFFEIWRNDCVKEMKTLFFWL